MTDRSRDLFWSWPSVQPEPDEDNIRLTFHRQDGDSKVHRFTVKIEPVGSETTILSEVETNGMAGFAGGKLFQVSTYPLPLTGSFVRKDSFDTAVMDQLTFGLLKEPLARALVEPVIASHCDAFMHAVTAELTERLQESGVMGFGHEASIKALNQICRSWSGVIHEGVTYA